jgi:hypothetical protein
MEPGRRFASHTEIECRPRRAASLRPGEIAHQPIALVKIERNAVVQRVPSTTFVFGATTPKVLGHALEPIGRAGAADDEASGCCL